MPITTILFDLDETLVPDEETTMAALIATCTPVERRLGVPAVALEAGVRARAREQWRAGPAIEYCQRTGISSWDGLWGDCGGADPALALLSAWLPGYRVESWRRALAASGLASFFDAVVVSGDVGAGKPDPRIFDSALSLAEARAEERVMVGDSVQRDVAGARQAGLRAVWLNRAGVASPPVAEPNATITFLRELPALLS